MNDKRPYFDLLKTIISGMIQKPESLQVVERRTPDKIFLGVDCHGDDYGQIVGKRARHIVAFQRIFTVIGKRRGEDVRISVAESGRTSNPLPSPFMDSNWKRDEELVSILDAMLAEMMDRPFFISPVQAGSTTILVVKSEGFKSLEFTQFLTEIVDQKTNTIMTPEILLEDLSSILKGWSMRNGRKSEIQLEK